MFSIGLVMYRNCTCNVTKCEPAFRNVISTIYYCSASFFCLIVFFLPNFCLIRVQLEGRMVLFCNLLQRSHDHIKV